MCSGRMILEVHDLDIEARAVAWPCAIISARQPGADPREARPDVVEAGRWRIEPTRTQAILSTSDSKTIGP